METKIYDFQKKYCDIKLSLELDKNKEELRYQCFTIGGKYRGNFEYKCKNGWVIKSQGHPDIDINGKVLYLRGKDLDRDEQEICINERYSLTKKDIEQLYYSIVEALEELGNEKDMQITDFYNKETGIELCIALDEKQEKLIYQCFGIKAELRGNCGCMCERTRMAAGKWTIKSDSQPGLSIDKKTLYLCGSNLSCDNNIIIVSKEKYRVYHENGDKQDFPCHKSYEDIKEMYSQIVLALNDIGYMYMGNYISDFSRDYNGRRIKNKEAKMSSTYKPYKPKSIFNGNKTNFILLEFPDCDIDRIYYTWLKRTKSCSERMIKNLKKKQPGFKRMSLSHVKEFCKKFKDYKPIGSMIIKGKYSKIETIIKETSGIVFESVWITQFEGKYNFNPSGYRTKSKKEKEIKPTEELELNDKPTESPKQFETELMLNRIRREIEGATDKFTKAVNEILEDAYLKIDVPENMKLLQHYMGLPYTIKIIPEEDRSAYFVEIEELDGCMSQGDTAEEALRLIVEAKELWFESAIEDGLPIPGPNILSELTRDAARMKKKGLL